MKRSYFNIQLIITAFCLFFASQSFGQSSAYKLDIKTSAQCGTCKKTIETGLNATEGVKYAVLDDETKVLTVKFNSEKLTPEQIRRIVTMLGYDADDMPADAAAYEALDACCKKE